MKRVIHMVFGTFLLIGIIQVLGVVGACDLETVDVVGLITKGGAGVLWLVIGCIGLKLSGWEYIA